MNSSNLSNSLEKTIKCTKKTQKIQIFPKNSMWYNLFWLFDLKKK